MIITHLLVDWVCLFTYTVYEQWKFSHWSTANTVALLADFSANAEVMNKHVS